MWRKRKPTYQALEFDVDPSWSIDDPIREDLGNMWNEILFDIFDEVE